MHQDSAFRFELEHVDPVCRARAGRLVTPHGEIETPVFMPVGTQGTVKSLCQQDLTALGTRIILSNAYHLYLRPGIEVMEQAGGLHRFMNWDGAILTDSGGFQVFSLAKLRKITPDGVTFQSHIDGSSHALTPERVIDIQATIGADIIMCFDECTPYPVEHATAAASMRLTLDWAARCKTRWLERELRHQALFGIVQGSTFEDLRRESAQRTVELDFPGYAAGGLSVGESKEEMLAAAEWVLDTLPPDKPRYFMGVGTPEDLLECVERGVDMFDCVMPTRIARNGTLFTSQGRINLKNQRHQRDFSPPDPACRCPVCRRYTRAYLAHLYRSGEISALRLNTLHNLHFMLELAARMRREIVAGRFPAFKRDFLNACLA